MNCLTVKIEHIKGISASVDRIEGLSVSAERIGGLYAKVKHACRILEAGPDDFNFSYDFNIDCSVGISIEK